MQRLRAVVAGANRDAVAVEQRRKIMRVDAFQRERNDDAGTDVRVGRPAVIGARAPRSGAPAHRTELALVARTASIPSAAGNTSTAAPPSPSPPRTPACRPRTSRARRSTSRPQNETLLIMSPPVMNGGISSSKSRLPYSTPIPVGPSILWPENTWKSQSSACNIHGHMRHRLAAVTITFAPIACARPTIGAGR